MARWLILAATLVALSVVGVILFGSSDEGGAPNSVVDAAKQSLSCPGREVTKVTCEPIRLDRWRCTGTNGGTGVVEIQNDHPESSVIC